MQWLGLGGGCPALFFWMTGVIKDTGENQSDGLDLGRGQLAAVSICRLQPTLQSFLGKKKAQAGQCSFIVAPGNLKENSLLGQYL